MKTAQTAPPKTKHRRPRPTIAQDLDAATERFHRLQDLAEEHDLCGNSWRSWWYRLRQSLAADQCARLEEAREAVRF